MILVTGATGNVGSEVVTALVERGRPVRALVRDPARARSQQRLPEGVDVAGGDLSDPDSVVPTLDGVEGVFLLGGFDSLGDLLVRFGDAGVGHVTLLTSRCVVGGVADNAITAMWLASEAALRAAGLPWTVLRPSGFASNALRWRPQLRAGDVVRAPWPSVGIAAIDPADIGAVAAAALDTRAYDGTALPLSGPAALTPGETVGQLGDVLGRPLRYEAQSDDEARAEMGSGPFVDAQFRFFSDGEYDDAVVVPTVADVLGRPPRSFRAWAEAHASAFG
jgi:uncharacterized protein YbjT (DUF2867 family)